MSLKFKCPHCESKALRSISSVLVACGIDEVVIRHDGSLGVEYDSNGSEVFWDSDGPPPKGTKPYDCGDCGAEFTPEEIRPNLVEDDEQP